MTGPRPERWALVVGGSGAIGSEICRQLAAAGWDIALTYHQNRPTAERVGAQVEAQGRRAIAAQLDLTDVDRASEVVSTCAGAGAPLSGIVYAAGPFFQMQYISQLPPRRFLEQIQQDTVACYNVLQPSIMPLRQTQGAIVAVSTPAVRKFLVSDILSSAPKAGIEAIVKGIAAEEGRHGIRANCVGVGVIEAGIWTRIAEQAGWGPERIEAARRAIPLRRLGTPADVGAAIEFLMSDRASWISGQVLDVDGGYGA
jgi:3-oxoacyl-[acyl-carrier protein] reductase